MTDIININGKDYFVADRFSYKDRNYIYIVSTFQDEKFSILDVSVENGKTIYESVYDPVLFTELVKIIDNDLK